MKRFSMAFLAAAFFFAGTSAFADARQHFMAGQDYYTQGRYEKAIEEFTEAYRLDPRPLLLYNIAMTYEKMGELEKAVDHLKRYLEGSPDLEDRTALLSKVASLEARIAKTGIKITANEPEATVYVDGKEIGKTPIAELIQLSVGAHKIQVSKNGFEDFKMSVAVSSGQTTPVEVVLEAGVAGPAPAVVETPAEDEAGEEEGDGKVEAMDVIPWAVAGVGAVTAGVGWGVLGTLAMKDDDHGKANIADIVGGAGAAIAVAGVVWGIVRITKKNKEEPTDDDVAAEADVQVSVVPVLGGETAGVAAAVQF